MRSGDPEAAVRELTMDEERTREHYLDRAAESRARTPIQLLSRAYRLRRLGAVRRSRRNARPHEEAAPHSICLGPLRRARCRRCSAGWRSPPAGQLRRRLVDHDRDASGAPPSPDRARLRRSSGKALTVNQIYTQDSPGVVYITAQQKAQPSPFNPFGQSQRRHRHRLGLRDRQRRPHPHQRPRGRRLPATSPFASAARTARPSTPRSSAPIRRPTSRCSRSTRASTSSSRSTLGSSSGVKVGDPVVAIGNPFGLDRTATAGIVSAVQRQIDSPNGFTIDERDPDRRADQPRQLRRSAASTPPASVIGINSQIESGGSGKGNVGIGFAVPIDTASEIAQQLIDNGQVAARLPRHQRHRPDPADRRRAQPRRQQRRPGPVGGLRAAPPTRPGSRPATPR